MDAKRPIPKAVAQWFRINGRRGGLIGGPARARRLTPEQRQAIARLGGLARQAKARAARHDRHAADGTRGQDW